MKRTFIILFGLTLLYVVGCSDDFVEVEPDGFNDSDFFNSQEEYESALIGAYDLLQSTFWNVLTGILKDVCNNFHRGCRWIYKCISHHKLF